MEDLFISLFGKPEGIILSQLIELMDIMLITSILTNLIVETC